MELSSKCLRPIAASEPFLIGFERLPNCLRDNLIPVGKVVEESKRDRIYT